MAKKKVVEQSDRPCVPKTLQDAIVYFADPDRVFEYAVARRWPDGVFCPFCDSPDNAPIAKRKTWRCRACNKQFSVRVGTIFEDSPISLSKWFTAIWMLINCKNGISSYELSRDLGVTQKTAWFMAHRIRAAIKAKSFDKKLCGIVEADECFIGGLFKNMHESRKRAIRGTDDVRGHVGKTIVQAVLERDGEVRAQIIANTDLGPRLDFLKANIDENSTLFTDADYNKQAVKDSFVHDFVNHEIEYVRGSVHTNSVENFWSLLQRGLNGTYIAVEPFHLSAYVDEQCFRFNNRKASDSERFERALAMVPTARLTYKELIRAEQA
jgi:transposase-like protein